MNKENIRKAIDVLQRAIDNQYKFSMALFQDTDNSTKILFDEKEMVGCGSVACFSGWLAVSPEWKEFGGIVCDVSGAAILITKDTNKQLSPAQSIAMFMDVPQRTAGRLIYPGGGIYGDIYGKLPCQIKPQDVIHQLTKLMEERSIQQ